MPVSRKVGRRGKAVNSVRKQKAMQKKSRYDRRVNTKSTLHGPTKQFRNNPYSTGPKPPSKKGPPKVSGPRNVSGRNTMQTPIGEPIPQRILDIYNLNPEYWDKEIID